MSLIDNLNLFHNQVAFDFQKGSLVAPHALPYYLSGGAASDQARPGQAGDALRWDDVEDRRFLDEYSASEMAGFFHRLYGGRCDRFDRTILNRRSQVPLRQFASKLVPRPDGLAPVISLRQNQFGALMMPQDGWMSVVAVSIICDAATLGAAYGWQATEAPEILFARVIENAFSARGNTFTVPVSGKDGEFNVKIYPRQAVGEPSGHIHVRARQARSAWMRANPVGSGRVALEPSFVPPRRETLADYVFEWRIFLPAPRRNEEGRVTERLPSRATAFWHRLEDFAKRVDLLKQEERLTRIGACEVN